MAAAFLATVLRAVFVAVLVVAFFTAGAAAVPAARVEVCGRALP